MVRTLGIVVGGIFVGAVAMEIIRKKYPDRLDKFYSSVGDVASGMKEGFVEGYQSITKSEAPAKA